MKKIGILALLLAVLIVIGLKGWPPGKTVVTGQAMGCSWTLACTGKAPESLTHEIAAELEHWEQVLSQWRPDSDLSRYNQGAPPTPDLQRVITLAEAIQTQTGPAFDIHLLESVHQAGFGPAGKGIDLSAIGKGFAVDRVGERLRSLGIDHFIFELGGEVLAGEGEWPCQIESPILGAPPIHTTLSNRAMATSGNYYQNRRTSSGLQSHLIDPRTGEPAIRPPCSVTVFATDCATADAWATALFILGPEKSPAGAPQFLWNPPGHGLDR